jgi:hypothetical protein
MAPTTAGGSSQPTTTAGPSGSPAIVHGSTPGPGPAQPAAIAGALHHLLNRDQRLAFSWQLAHAVSWEKSTVRVTGSIGREGCVMFFVVCGCEGICVCVYGRGVCVSVCSPLSSFGAERREEGAVCASHESLPAPPLPSPPHTPHTNPCHTDEPRPNHQHPLPFPATPPPSQPPSTPC